MDETALIRDELDGLYSRQRQAEYADLDGRVCDRWAWRRSIDERAERIRELEKRLEKLEPAEVGA